MTSGGNAFKDFP